MIGRIDLSRRPAAYRPGELVEGAVSWNAEKAPGRHVELRLFWTTQGKGSSETVVVATELLSGPLPEDVRKFSMRLPDMPYTYHGSVFAIVWEVEAVVPWVSSRLGSHLRRLDEQIASARLVVSPTLNPITHPHR